ncbi:hypothetical protein BGZ47_000720 [Haplosporangium gracile]|nr:hypothetical protein BGZ47_000720 [Haplosporangium gracile]
MKPWHPRITTRFTLINSASSEKTYYGSYNAILSQIFTIDEGFMVHPQAYPLDTYSVEFLVELAFPRLKAIPVIGMKTKRILQHDPEDETENLAPSTNWNIDISTLEDRQALLEYFNDVKAMCDELPLES